MVGFMDTKPAEIYASIIDDATLAQFEAAMAQPFSVAGALMADAHVGYALPIGGVVATEGVVVPSWVGVDIGCGVLTAVIVRRDNPGMFGVEAKARNWDLLRAIYEKVPVGFHHNAEIPDVTLPESSKGSAFLQEEVLGRRKVHKTSVGTLGGGNHFIELGIGSEGSLNVTIHSGSRGVGYALAEHHMKIAAGANGTPEGTNPLDVGSPEGAAYLADMDYALEFALANRLLILDRVVSAISEVFSDPTVTYRRCINRNHNHATQRLLEVDGGVRDVWIHRKGATHAEQGMLGVVPGNMLDGCFVVRGTGNSKSLYSSSHGAGRVLGRRQAQKLLRMDDFEEKMRGIAAVVHPSTLDESPGAYKDIHTVMLDQRELVTVVDHLRPIAVVKSFKLKAGEPAPFSVCGSAVAGPLECS